MMPRPSLMALAIGALLGTPAAAQEFGPGREVVQPLPSQAAAELRAALARLARDPRNLDALIAAGTASLELNDIDAAVGFFGRAADLAPGDPRVKAGKAAAYVRTKRPDEALRLFQEAEAAGVEIVRLAGDYGLAWDLVGNNREAQNRYRQALAAAPADDETIRRLALSLAIDGDARGFEQTLQPLIARRDFAAYRTRAFGLAILGKPDDAVAITEAVMDRAMAGKLEPYLRFMPQLTKAQQAAAANLGIYPTAARIGRDDPRIAAYSGTTPAAPASPARTPDAALAPAGQALGVIPDRLPQAPSSAPPATAAVSAPSPALSPAPLPARSAATREEAERSVRLARREAASDPLARTAERPRIVERPRTDQPALSAPEPSAPVTTLANAAAEAVPVPAATGPSAPLAGVRVPELAPASPAFQATAPVSAPEVPASAPAASPAPVVVARIEDSAVAAPGFDLAAAMPPASAPVAQPVAPSVALSVAPSATPSTAPAPSTPAAGASVANAFADLALPSASPATTPAAGAVDITAIRAPREVERPVATSAAAPASATKAPSARPAAKPEPAKPSHPSRFWVQVATGQDKAALRFDWRRLAKQAGGLLDGKGPYLTAWGQTSRLLAGPYKTREDARKALKDLQEKGFDAFTFTSPDGQEVEQLR